MREPMNAIVGMTRLLRQSVLDDEQRQHLEAIDDAAGVVLTLVNDLLDLGRAASGALQVVSVPFDPATLAHRCVRLLETRKAGAAVTLRARVTPEVPVQVLGDPARIRQVLLNLLGNALKFTDSGSVTLEVAAIGGERLRFRVVDTGIGVDADLLASMQESYVQAPSAARAHGGGSGLGLAIVKALVEAMAGELSIESREGGGTSIAVTLALPAVVSPSKPAHPATHERRMDELNLVLVEPQTAARGRLVDILNGWGVMVESCASQAEAQGCLEARFLAGDAPDALVVADHLADGSAAELGGWVRRHCSEPMRMIVLVDSGLRGDAERLRAAGFDAYLPSSPAPNLLRRAFEALFTEPETALVTTHALRERGPGALRVLVVDDNPVNLKLARILLERAGHRVHEALSGEEALSSLDGEVPDIVLMDIQMPGMNGLKTTEAIRRREGSEASVPVVALTGQSPELAGGDWARAGMQGWLTKPIDAPQLLRTIERAVAARPQRT